MRASWMNDGITDRDFVRPVPWQHGQCIDLFDRVAQLPAVVVT